MSTPFPEEAQVRRDRRGFTVIELLMVIIMISVMAAVALPRINVSGMKSDGAARLVRSVMIAAQRTSITRQSNTIVSFDTANSQLRIVEDYNNNDSLNTSDRITYKTLPDLVRFRVPSMARVTGGATATSLVGSNLRTVSSLPSVIFRRDGSASTDVELYLGARAGMAADFRVLTIAPSTGRTDLFRWTGSTWLRVTQ